jgi:hypothetical protein
MIWGHIVLRKAVSLLFINWLEYTYTIAEKELFLLRVILPTRKRGYPSIFSKLLDRLIGNHILLQFQLELKERYP